MAIGARSQSARTYVEKHLHEFPDCEYNTSYKWTLNNKQAVHYELFLGSLEELIKHGLRALRDTLPAEVELTNKVDK